MDGNGEEEGEDEVDPDSGYHEDEEEEDGVELCFDLEGLNKDVFDALGVGEGFLDGDKEEELNGNYVTSNRYLQ